jgi:glutaminase
VISPIQTYLEQLHARHAALGAGEVASYIPELAKANPDWFGIALATTDGHLYEVGDTRLPFTIQSISKPIVYGLALEDRGRRGVLSKVGVEPSGDAFNSISLEPGTGRPLNPMINAGAIATTSLIAGHSADDRLHRLLAVFSIYAGRSLALDETVYRSERETGHRNRAIGHMLRNFEILIDDPDAALDLYFRQCSIAVDCRDLAVIAATLANGGVNPRTTERAVRHEHVESILSIMTTCGMYDYAGEWVYTVGMPAKSGVAGGLLAVLPGQLGIGVFSPRLDPRGNSVRGVAVCRDLSRDFNLHFLRVPRAARSCLRGQHSLAGLGSKRRRSEAERAVLDAVGDRVRIYDLQGDLSFSGIELVVRRIVETTESLEVALLDLRRVTEIEPCAAGLLIQLIVALGEQERHLVVVGADGHPGFWRALQEGLANTDHWGRLVGFPDLDPALEWCENRLLAAHGDGSAATLVTLAHHHLCDGLTSEQLASLEALLEPRQYRPGDVIIHRGDRADEVYLLMNGQVSVTVDLSNGQQKRLSTISPGMAFGELAVIDRSPRTADVRADTPVECRILSATVLDQLARTAPAIRMRLLENLLRHVHHMVGRLNQELATFER